MTMDQPVTQEQNLQNEMDAIQVERRHWLAGIPFLVVTFSILLIVAYSYLVGSRFAHNRYLRIYSDNIQLLHSSGVIDFASEVAPASDKQSNAKKANPTEKELDYSLNLALLALHRTLNLQHDNFAYRFEYALLEGCKANWLDDKPLPASVDSIEAGAEKHRKASGSSRAKARAYMQSIASSTNAYQARATAWLIRSHLEDSASGTNRVVCDDARLIEWIETLRQSVANGNTEREPNELLGQLLLRRAMTKGAISSPDRGLELTEAEGYLQRIEQPFPSTFSWLADVVAFRDEEASLLLADKALHRYWQSESSIQKRIDEAIGSVQSLMLVSTQAETESLASSLLHQLSKRDQATFRQAIADACFRRRRQLELKPQANAVSGKIEPLSLLGFAIQLDPDNDCWIAWTVDHLKTGAIEESMLSLSTEKNSPAIQANVAERLILLQSCLQSEDDAFEKRLTSVRLEDRSINHFTIGVVQRLYVNKFVSPARALRILDTISMHGPNRVDAMLHASSICIRERDIQGARGRLDLLEKSEENRPDTIRIIERLREELSRLTAQ